MYHYDLEYLEGRLRQNSATADLINKIRWNFVKEVQAKTVLDYGCGVGWFRAWRPNEVEMDSFDIAKEYPQTGINRKNYDLVCFWDVIEHVDWKDKPDKVIEKVLKTTKFVALTVPILPEGQKVELWKHYKPGEHLTRFEKITEVIKFFKDRGFKIIKVGTPECPPSGPRQDIYSFLFKRYDKKIKCEK